MMHNNRTWSIKPATPEEIAADMERTTWCSCNGYIIEHDGAPYLVINDATGENGAQEYAIVEVLGGPSAQGSYIGRQIESLTLSWMKTEEIATSIRRACEYRGWVGEQRVIHCDDWQHHRCHLCA